MSEESDKIARDICAAFSWSEAKRITAEALAAAHLVGRISQAKEDAEIAEGECLQAEVDDGTRSYNDGVRDVAAAIRVEADKLEKGSKLWTS